MLKKIFLTLFLALFFTVPIKAYAAEFQSGGDITVAADQVINDDLYVAGQKVSILGTLNGDLIAAGSNINVSGSVNGNIIAAGSDLDISGSVSKSIRAAGESIKVSGKVGKDLITASNEFQILAGGEVLGQVIIAASKAEIDGNIGSLKAVAQTLSLKQNANVNGDVLYYSEKDAEIAPESKINGKVEKREEKFIALTKEVETRQKLLGLLYLFVVTLIVFLIMPKSFKTVSERWKAHFWLNLLWGFIALIAIPLASIILFATVIGAPFALGLLLIYPIILYLGSVMGIVSLGAWLKALYEKNKEIDVDLVSIILGFALYGLFLLIGPVGALFQFVVFLAGFGTLVAVIYTKFKNSRETL